MKTNIQAPSQAYNGIPDPIERWFDQGTKPKDKACPRCGSKIELDSLGHLMLWRCVADPTHTGSWIDDKSREVCAAHKAVGAKPKTTSMRATLSKSILSILGDGKTYKGLWLAEMLNVSPYQISDALIHMRKKGLVVKVSASRATKWRKA